MRAELRADNEEMQARPPCFPPFSPHIFIHFALESVRAELHADNEEMQARPPCFFNFFHFCSRECACGAA